MNEFEWIVNDILIRNMILKVRKLIWRIETAVGCIETNVKPRTCKLEVGQLVFFGTDLY